MPLLPSTRYSRQRPALRHHHPAIFRASRCLCSCIPAAPARLAIFRASRCLCSLRAAEEATRGLTARDLQGVTMPQSRRKQDLAIFKGVATPLFSSSAGLCRRTSGFVISKGITMPVVTAIVTRDLSSVSGVAMPLLPSPTSPTLAIFRAPRCLCSQTGNAWPAIFRAPRCLWISLHTLQRELAPRSSGRRDASAPAHILSWWVRTRLPAIFRASRCLCSPGAHKTERATELFPRSSGRHDASAPTHCTRTRRRTSAPAIFRASRRLCSLLAPMGHVHGSTSRDLQGVTMPLFRYRREQDLAIFRAPRYLCSHPASCKPRSYPAIFRAPRCLCSPICRAGSGWTSDSRSIRRRDASAPVTKGRRRRSVTDSRSIRRRDASAPPKKHEWFAVNLDLAIYSAPRRLCSMVQFAVYTGLRELAIYSAPRRLCSLRPVLRSWWELHSRSSGRHDASAPRHGRRAASRSRASRSSGRHDPSAPRRYPTSPRQSKYSRSSGRHDASAPCLCLRRSYLEFASRSSGRHDASAPTEEERVPETYAALAIFRASRCLCSAARCESDAPRGGPVIFRASRCLCSARLRCSRP